MEVTIEERIAKYFDVEISKIKIGESEHRENYRGKNLENGCPVFVLMNTGVEIDEENCEFFGWIINGRWIKENC